MKQAATLALLIAGACASTPPTGPHGSAPLPLLPRSSLAALLNHRADLALDDTQVERLSTLDAALETRKASVRQSLESARAAKGPENGAEDRMRGGGRGSGMGSGGMGGSSLGGGGMGGRGMSGGPGMGRGGQGGAPGSPSRPNPEAQAERAIDDDDRQAFLEAEGLLRPDQQERAREIAERYREALYDARQARPGDRPRR